MSSLEEINEINHPPVVVRKNKWEKTKHMKLEMKQKQMSKSYRGNDYK